MARRTIHFSDKQMYWECSEMVHCGNVTRSRRYDLVLLLPKSFEQFTLFLLPHRQTLHALRSESGPQRTLNCTLCLVQEYSKQSLSFLTDRRVAASALEDRINRALTFQSRYASTKTFSTEVSYGAPMTISFKRFRRPLFCSLGHEWPTVKASSS